MDARAELFGGLESFLKKLIALTEAEGLSFLADVELSFAQVRTTMLLACSEPLPISSVADRLDLSVHAASRNIDRLVETGIVERRESPEDRRVKLVSLSRRGLEMMDQHTGVRRRALRAFVDRLPDDQVDAFLDVLQSVLAGDSLHPRPQPQGQSRAQEPDAT